MRRLTRPGCLILIAASMLGCQGNRYTTSPQAWSQTPSGQVPPGVDWDARISKMDANNRALHQQLAQSQQQNEILRGQVQALQTRLGETAQQLQAAQEGQKTAESQLAALRESTRRRGGATITANTSLRRTLEIVGQEIPGVTARRDGDVIRFSVSSDLLFQPGTGALQPSMQSSLDQVAGLVARHYPRQRIAVEAYTDASASRAGDAFRLTSTQSLTVLEYLTGRNRLPAEQFVAVAQGAGPATTTPDGQETGRRIDVVVYPETF